MTSLLTHYPRLLPLTILFLLNLSGRAQTTDTVWLNREQMKQDIAFFIKTLEEAHPDPYAVIGREAFAGQRDSLLHALPDRSDRLSFYRQLARLVAQLKDSHTRLNLPGEYRQLARDSVPIHLPLRLERSDTFWIIAKNYTDNTLLRPGLALRSINNQPIGLLTQRLLELTPYWDKRRLAANLPYYLYLAGLRAPFRLAVFDPATGNHTITQVDGLSYQQLARYTQGPDANYRFDWLDGEVGYLDFRRMASEPARPYPAFLDSTFQALKDRAARGLIVDMRNNPGGNSRLGQQLLSYITDKPFRMTGGVAMKSSPARRRAFKQYLPGAVRWLPLQYLHPVGWRFWILKPRGVVRMKAPKARRPKAEPLRFYEPVVFLIGPATASSAMMTVDAAASYELAVLIGEETGGRPNDFGEILSFQLPNSGISFVSSTARWTSTADPVWQGGVVPDVEVRPTLEGIELGRDEVLETARTFIRKMQ